jgi:Lysozyme like domain
MAPKVVPLFVLGGGALFAYSALSGKSWSGALKNLIKGKTPTTASTTQSITGTPLSAVAGYGYGIGSGTASPTVKGVFTNSQLQSLWISAGGNPAKAAVAACIADHESSGNPAAQSANPDGGTNVGLWQLDTKGKGAGFSVSQLLNPILNARVAVRGSANGTNWSAWATAGSCGV